MLLNSKNLISIKLIKKLNYKYYDSFEINKFIKKQLYKLKFFKIFRSMHNVFYVLLLKSFKKQIKKTSKFTIIKNQKHWKIDKIINNKIHYNKLKYLIKWKNCLNKNDEYLFVQNFKRTKNLMRKFITEYSHKFNQKIQKC